MYIKIFEEYNEHKRNLFAKELKEFCEINLVYLIDMGFRIFIIDGIESGGSFNGFKINIVRSNNNDRVSWDEIKDYFIPFFHFLDKKYIFKKATLLQKSGRKIDKREILDYIQIGTTLVKKEDILNDRINNNIWVGTNIQIIVARLKNKNDK